MGNRNLKENRRERRGDDGRKEIAVVGTGREYGPRSSWAQILAFTPCQHLYLGAPAATVFSRGKGFKSFVSLAVSLAV